MFSWPLSQRCIVCSVPLHPSDPCAVILSFVQVVVGEFPEGVSSGSMQNIVVQGTAVGLSPTGQLLVRREGEDTVETITAGDVSVRPH